MSYNINYDIAALLITITVMVHYFHNRTINTRQTRLFTTLIWFSLVSTLLDIVTCFTITYSRSVPLSLNYALNELYLITTNIIPMIYYAYIVLLTLDQEKLSTKYKVRIFVPAATSMLLIVPTFWTKLVIRFNEDKVYSHGPLMNMVYAIVLVYLILALSHTYQYRKNLTISQKSIAYFYTVSSIAAVVLQVILSDMMLIHFAISLCTLLIYLSLENPSDYSDKALGLFNTTAFEAIASPLLNRKKHFEVMGIRIDGLKYISDAMGMQNVNYAMRQAAEFLTQIAGRRKKVFHITGYQFAILSDEKKTDWESLITELQVRFRRPFWIENVEVSLSVQLCILSYPENVHTLKDIIDMTQYLLEDYEAAAKDEVLYGNEEFLIKGRRENQIVQIIKDAIRDNGFEVYFQPIYSVHEKKFITAEALIRLRHKELGFISPEEFIPLAEQNGLILEIGEFVFREVCRFIKEENLPEKGIRYVHVNLSTIQCMQEKLHETLLSIMDEYELPYSTVSLEITETAAVISGDLLWHNMQKLEEKGIHFAMDDYGTGFSNTASIIKYPFHTIKLDKSMLWSAMDNDKAMCALKHTSAMIKDMKMELLAEGVETLEQANLLEDMGCDLFQGYYYSKPLCEKDFLEKIG
jgi:EAL domain-containing protein (putative c-di-GMP-specific phosphodiesterase class I)/GGDEF domain-containing protein